MQTSWIRLSLFAVAMALAVALGALLRVEGQALAMVSLAAGLLLAALLAQRRQHWPAYLGIAVAVQGLVEFFVVPGATIPESISFGFLTALQAYLAAHLALSLLNKPRRRTTGSEMTAYSSIAALTVPGLVGLLAAMVLHYTRGSEFLPVFAQWWAANLLGIVLVVPTYLMQAQLRGQPSARRPPRIAESTITVALLIATSLYVLGSDPSLPQALAIFSIVPFVLLLAFRADPRVVGSALLVVFLIAGQNAIQGKGPFYTPDSDWHSVYTGVQLYFLVLSISALVVTWAVYDRKHADGLFLRRVNIGDFIVDCSRRFTRTPFAQLDGDIRLALEQLGQFAAADRVWLMQFDLERNCLSVSHSWARHDVEDLGGLIDGLSFDRFPWSIAKLKAGEQLLLQCKEPPAGSEEDVKSLSFGGTRAIGYTPLFGDSTVIGAIGIDWVHSDPLWSDDVVALLHIIGQLFVGALRRQRNRLVINQYERRLRNLATEVALTEERARRQTAIDLHDGIGQNLAVSCINITQLEKELGADHASLSTLRETVNSAMRQTRSLVSELSPPMLYELGVASALRSLTQSMSKRALVNIEFEQEGDSRELPEEVGVAIYRAARELLTNMIKHANASQARVLIRYSEDHVSVLVSDDGVGFDIGGDGGSVVASGFGLFSIRESALSLGGSVTIDSGENEGSRITLTLPYGESGGRKREYGYEAVDA